MDDSAADGMTTTPPPLQLRELPLEEIEPNLSQARRSGVSHIGLELGVAVVARTGISSAS